ncbi:hypothetical protein JOQ06_012117 [Pogonophryne albipinna]|uniref:Uncharacterized protein n=1 Tax=Pogonophryne albipinna TaxID=1090488 RepID=A0AAD6BEM4_9TELE|nr:hypothetical protein JOQ06_012117 [Pogonophryne albipinna]
MARRGFRYDHCGMRSDRQSKRRVHGCAATPGAERLPHIWRNEFDPLKGHRKLPLKAANKSSSGEQEPRAPFIAANDLFIKSDDG